MLGDWELFLPLELRRPKCAVCERRTDGDDVCADCRKLLANLRETGGQ